MRRSTDFNSAAGAPTVLPILAVEISSNAVLSSSHANITAQIGMIRAVTPLIFQPGVRASCDETDHLRAGGSQVLEDSILEIDKAGSRR